MLNVALTSSQLNPGLSWHESVPEPAEIITWITRKRESQSVPEPAEIITLINRKRELQRKTESLEGEESAETLP